MKNIIEKISDYALEEIMGERFGRYCKAIIQDRAIPDVRDGLKPVQRRILFSMYKEKNTHDKPYHKSARAVGDIMGKYHPHGDSSIYDAMVRMSQDWKMKTPYIDMHGNNGSIDGDSPAAMRYTESRLTEIAEELLKDIEKDTVIMAPNYDDTLKEPTVLPAKFPNLLINGSMGISAGYATNIPPHNLGEVIDATIMRIDNPNSTIDDMLTIVKGPDFPTGGIVEGLSGIRQAYETGKGRIIVKSKILIENNKGKNQIIIPEIPYEVNKSILVSKINDIRIEKKIDGILDVRDESDREGLRIAIDIKKEADSNLIINYLLKNTDLQITYNFNVIAIANRRPKLLSLINVLDEYIAFQEEVIIKRTRFDLDHANARFHIVEGLIRALSILDEVIATIRASKNKIDAQENLVKSFGFTDLQAEAIVILQLYRLTNTDVTALEEELKNLTKIINMLNKILTDKSFLKKIMKDELLKVKEKYDVPRLTEIKEEITEIKIDTTSLIPKEDVIVVVTKEGYVKRVSLRSYNASEDETVLKEGDYVIGLYEMSTLDTLLVFTNMGNYLYIPVHEIPDTKWKELGKHVSNIIAIKADENIIGCVPVYNFESKGYITTFTKDGMVKRTELSEYKATRYSKPITAIKLKEADEVVSVNYGNESNVLVGTYNGYALWYDVNEIPVTGLRASGVKAINLKDDYVISGLIFNDNYEYITVITDKGTGKRVRLKDLEKSSRARRGLLIIREVKTNPHHIVKVFVSDNKKTFGVKSLSEIKLLKASEFTIMDRYSTGSNVCKGTVKDAFDVKSLDEITDKDNSIPIEKEEKEPEKDNEYKQLSLLDVDNDLDKIDDMLDSIDDEL